MATNRNIQGNQKKETMIVNDIVHEIIKLPCYIQTIIDTDQFQRLRYISQLGFTSFVYPSAHYSRFEHSIGTFHLASKFIRQIKSQLDKDIADKRVPEEISVSEDDIKCVEIAALCHDLGHGPYSHFWEHAFDEAIPTRKHEEISAEIFSNLINSTKSGHNQSIKKEIDLKDEYIELVKRLISGKIDKDKDKKPFLFEIVANKESGLDVDKLDYLCRDSIYLGWSNKNKLHDVKRIIHFLRVSEDGENEWHLAMRDREIFHIHDVFYYRHSLHRYGYQHKTGKIIECLFKEAIKSIVENPESRKEFIGNVLGKDYIKDETYDEKDNEVWFSTKFISKVCNHHVWEIMKIYTSNIVTQIQERKLYKLHCQIQVSRKNQIKGINKKIKSLRIKLQQLPDDQKEKFKNLKEILDEMPDILIEKDQNGDIKKDVKSLIEILKEKELEVIGIADIAISQFSLQSENKGNPLLSVRFYRKTAPNKCFNMAEEDLPGLVKLKSDEFIIMIFTKENKGGFESLDKITDILCSETFDTKNFSDVNIDEEMKGKLNDVIKKLRENYEFRKNLY